MVHGKWGATSFTSLRTVNGITSSKDHSIPQQPNSIEDSGIGVSRKREFTSKEATPSVNASTIFAAPRPKKFFKSRDTTSKQEPTLETNNDNISETKLHSEVRPMVPSGKTNVLERYI